MTSEVEYAEEAVVPAVSRDIRGDIDHILVTEEDLHSAIGELGRTLTREYAGKELLLVGVLRGAIMFIVDLARAVDLPLTMDFMAVASYGASTETSGIVRILKDLDSSIEGKHVLVVEDIIDSGLTLNYILDTLRTRNPASVRVAALLNKPARRRVDVGVDYVCFDIPDEFVVGYGLDFNQIYRNLPFVGVLKPEAYLQNGHDSGEDEGAETEI
ncbi:MAG: hypoxanthine phosphoribosyltransferase [Chloroflexia bacterium]|jgi:hypoxanthine phosphoribosyltransferase|nr:hypoxanthine phosphoribosyltransferase [Chloroflexia bacterium]